MKAKLEQDGVEFAGLWRRPLRVPAAGGGEALETRVTAYAGPQEAADAVSEERGSETPLPGAADGWASVSARARDFRPDGLPVGRPFAKGHGKAGGRVEGVPNRVTKQVREQARQMVEDPRYRRRVVRDLRAGALHPALEAMLWYYAYGRPVERIRMTGIVGRTDLVAALEQAWEQLRGRDPRRALQAALVPGPDGGPKDAAQ